MAVAIMPALQTGGRIALQQLPGVLSAVKSRLPGIYKQVTNYTAKSNKTPEEVVTRVIAKNDKILGQAVLETMMKNGVTPEFINNAAPLLPIEELRRIQIKFADIDQLERGIANTSAATIDGDPDVVFAHDNSHIVRVCRALGITSEQLADVLTFFKTRSPEVIKRYQAFERSSGRKPV